MEAGEFHLQHLQISSCKYLQPFSLDDDQRSKYQMIDVYDIPWSSCSRTVFHVFLLTILLIIASNPEIEAEWLNTKLSSSVYVGLLPIIMISSICPWLQFNWINYHHGGYTGYVWLQPRSIKFYFF